MRRSVGPGGGAGVQDQPERFLSQQWSYRLRRDRCAYSINGRRCHMVLREKGRVVPDRATLVVPPFRQVPWVEVCDCDRRSSQCRGQATGKATSAFPGTTEFRATTAPLFWPATESRLL